MSKIVADQTLTTHPMLVLWDQFAQPIGLVEELETIPGAYWIPLCSLDRLVVLLASEAASGSVWMPSEFACTSLGDHRDTPPPGSGARDLSRADTFV